MPNSLNCKELCFERSNFLNPFLSPLTKVAKFTSCFRKFKNIITPLRSLSSIFLFQSNLINMFIPLSSPRRLRSPSLFSPPLQNPTLFSTHCSLTKPFARVEVILFIYAHSPCIHLAHFVHITAFSNILLQHLTHESTSSEVLTF